MSQLMGLDSLWSLGTPVVIETDLIWSSAALTLPVHDLLQTLHIQIRPPLLGEHFTGCP